MLHAEPKLVPDISQSKVEIRSSFSGTELLLFGAIINKDIERHDKIDVVVILRGPDQSIIIREKQKVGGIWINAASQEYLSVPSYYSIASSAPLEKIVDRKTALIYELGINRLQLSPGGIIDQNANQRFVDGLADLLQRKSIYAERQSEVQITDNVLYRARLYLPSNVPVGTYIAETLLLSNGEVIAANDKVRVEIKKVGFEALITKLAEQYSLFYGLLAVFISLFLGWIAGRIFQK
ncbi:TIGR02186 family protein [Sphingorhabdus lutea]|nr:TIGR02186 family protein [Sphingorhabdus lutea]